MSQNHRTLKTDKNSYNLQKDIQPILKAPFINVMVFGFFINILMLTSPLYMMQIYDRVLGSGSVETLIFLTLAAGGLLFVNGMLETVRMNMLRLMGTKFEKHISAQLFTNLAATHLMGKGLQKRPLRDVENIRQFMSGQALIALVDAPWTPLFLAILFLLHPLLGITALIGAFILFTLALITELTTREKQKESAEASQRSHDITNSVIKNADIVQAMGIHQALHEHWQRENENALFANDNAEKRSAFLRGLSKFFRPFLQALILGLGAYLTLQGEITAGAIIAASILMGRALGPVEQGIGSWRTYVGVRHSWQNLHDFICEMAPLSRTKTQQPMPKGCVHVDNLIIRLEDNSLPLLKAIDFHAHSGEAIALVGPSGSGKSTLLRAMAGLLHPSRGAVRYDHVDILNWPETQRASLIGYLPQHVSFFAGSVGMNIARMEHPDAEKLHIACQQAGVRELIGHLSDGYDTLLTPDGNPLAAGARQRIGLARALYGKPKIILLDEPNAHLDAAGERLLVGTILQLKASGHVFFIATHRTGLLKATDRMLVLNDGQLVADRITKPNEMVSSKINSKPQDTQTNGQPVRNQYQTLEASKEKKQHVAL